MHDMHGNVWEWCSNLFGLPPGSDSVVIRGGSFMHSAKHARAAFRTDRLPTFLWAGLGVGAVRDIGNP